MGFDEGRIVFDHEDLSYNAGQIIHGKVVFNQEKDKTFRGIYAKIRGYCDVHWETTHTRKVNERTEHYTVEHTSHETYFTQKMYLVGSQSGEVRLQPGHHEFPFQCLIPSHCPSSFEGDYGHVKYEVKVVLDRSFKFDQEKCVQIRVINLKDLNADPYCKEPMLFEFEDTYCCWCTSQGICETKAKLPQCGYCPGQTINIELECENESNVEINSIKFELVELTEFTAVNNPEEYNEESVIAKTKDECSIPGNTTRNWKCEIDIPEMDVYNLEACKYIDIRYELRMIVSPSGCRKNSEDTRRIVLGHVPLREVEDSPQGDHVAAQPVAPPLAQYPECQSYPGQNPGQFQPPYPGANPSFPAPNPSFAVANPPYAMPNPSFPGANPSFPAQNPSFPGANPSFPAPNPSFPGANPSFPAQNPSFPGANPSFPAQNPSFPGANPPYPVPNPSFPGANPPYPVPNPPFPGANSSYPNNPPPYAGATQQNPPGLPGVSPYPVGFEAPGQPGFVADSKPSYMPPYPANDPAVSPFASASAPMSMNPDGDGKNPPYNPDFEKK